MTTPVLLVLIVLSGIYSVSSGLTGWVANSVFNLLLLYGIIRIALHSLRSRRGGTVIVTGAHPVRSRDDAPRDSGANPSLLSGPERERLVVTPTADLRTVRGLSPTDRFAIEQERRRRFD